MRAVALPALRSMTALSDFRLTVIPRHGLERPSSMNLAWIILWIHKGVGIEPLLGFLCDEEINGPDNDHQMRKNQCDAEFTQS